MNETLKVLETRRSCRNFKPDMITTEELQAIIRADTYAATGMGRQSPLIIAVTNKKLRDQIAEENRKIGGWGEDFDPFYGAPVSGAGALPAARRSGGSGRSGTIPDCFFSVLSCVWFLVH